MPAAPKSTPNGKEKDRRKSGSKPALLSTLRVSPERLRKIVSPDSIKAETPIKELTPAAEPSPEETAAPATNGTNGDVAENGDAENGTASSPGTPAPAGTPSQSAMGPPSEAPKKKGVKRSAAKDLDPTARVRGKPGPKKKPRLDDGTAEPAGRGNAGTYHRLGPKANQGAINAGLRALDRSGAPCRKWNRGGFRVKTFTGVVWEIPRWTAPPKSVPGDTSEDPTASTDSSNKENKEEGSQLKSEKSASNAPDGEQPSVAPSVQASSPAPVAVAAAS